MKHYYIFKRTALTTLVLLLIGQLLFAQTPPSDLTGSALRTWLKTNYYDGHHTQLGYDNARAKMYNYIDNHNNTITCVYSGYQVVWTYGGTGTNPDPINCEHTVPQSYFNEAEPMKSDLHHLFPTYNSWNSTRSNYPFAEIDDNITTKWMYLATSQTTIPTSNIDLYSEYASSKFEPREDHKGDVARAIFYFYTMYPTQAGAIGTVADINTLYDWSISDPVSQAEIDRNVAIQSFQGDLNPYITMPSLIAKAWDLTPGDPTVPDVPTLALSAGVSSIGLTWNDVSTETGYKIYRSLNSGSYTLLTSPVANATSYTDNAVSTGNSYSYYIVAYNDLGNSSTSNVVTGQLNSGGSSSYASELILSEYVEGSSNNKAIEIANFTGSAVNLGNYSIKKQTNGAGDWASELLLSGTLNHGDVYVIVYGSAGTTLLALADLTTTSQAMTFNGNDPVGLFKSGTLIDVIGTFNSTAIFATDKTLVRNASVTSPNTTYVTSEWTEYPIDTYSYLGSHTMDLGTTADTEAPTTPTNLAASNITTSSLSLSWTVATDNVGVTDYLVYQNGSQVQTVTAPSASISGLTASTAYSFYVKAKDAAGNTSSASSTINATTLTAPDTQVPTAPTNLVASNITTSSLSLSWTAATDNVGVTGYLVYQNGSQVQTVTTTSASISGLTASTAYSYYVKAKDGAGNTSLASSTINVTTATPSSVYCTSKGSNFSYEWISGITIGSFTKTSGASGYTDYTSTIVNLEAGKTYSVSLTPSFSGSSYNEYWKIWIDYNNDADFGADELAFDAGALSKTTVTGTLTIPVSATGTTRMRVSMKYNAAQTACETFSYGEVEDYTVSISASVPDTEAPSTPASLSASGTTATTTALTWSACSDNVAVSGYEIYKNGTLAQNVTTNSASISGLTASTTYSFYVIAYDAAGNHSLASNTINVTTPNQTITYCASKGSNSSYEWIDLVQIGSISNTTGNDGGYADYTSQVATVVVGSNTISYSAGFGSSSYTEYWHVWIDLNHDGTFGTDERLVYGSSSSSGTLSSTFTVPTTALTGTTRMRVTMKYNGTATSCETFSYGEVEDYTVNIVTSAQKELMVNDAFAETLGEPNQQDYIIYPNPAHNDLQIDLSTQRDAEVYLYDLFGRLVLAQPLNGLNETIDLSSIESGVYLVTLNNDGKITTQRIIKQ